MKKIYILLLIVIGSFTLASCSPAVTAVPTWTPDGNFVMPTPYPTLPVEIQDQLYKLLQTNGDCEFPCFLGLMPGRIFLDQANAFFEVYTRDHRMLDYPVYIESPYQWYYSPDFDTKQGNLHIFFHLYVQSNENIVTGFIVNFQSVMKSDRTVDTGNRLLERYGIIELFERHGVPDQILFNPTGRPHTGSMYDFYDIEVVYHAYKIMASYGGLAKLAENGKHELCPALGDGNIDSFSMAFADPVNPDVNIIEFMWGSFNENFDLEKYEAGRAQLDPQGIYDLFVHQGKRCFYEDEYWLGK